VAADLYGLNTPKFRRELRAALSRVKQDVALFEAGKRGKRCRRPDGTYANLEGVTLSQLRDQERRLETASKAFDAGGPAQRLKQV